MKTFKKFSNFSQKLFKKLSQNSGNKIKHSVPAMILLPIWLIVKLNDEFKAERFARLLGIKNAACRTSKL